MTAFHTGDRAYCTQPQSSGGALAHGTLYFVARVGNVKPIRHPDGLKEPGEQYLFLLGASAEEGWNASRFRRVDGQDRLWPMRGTFDKWEEPT